MDETDLINGWLAFKRDRFQRAASYFYRLKAPISAAYTYHPQGDPYRFAGVRFSCAPSEELSFRSVAEWPASIPPDDMIRVEAAIGNGIVEALLSEPLGLPYRGCSIVLGRVEWDEVGSSEMAYWWATREAMRELIAKGQWEYTFAAKGAVF